MRPLFIAALAAGLLAGAATAVAQPAEPPAWPPVTPESRPWTRWWWQGSAVSPEDLTAAMEAYRRAGLGGLEITPIYGVAGHEARFVPYLSPAWMELLGHTLREAERLGLGIDLATGTGWPFGGPWVTPEDASKNVVHRTFTLRGGERLAEPVVYRQEPMVRAVGSQIYELYGLLKAEGEQPQGSPDRPPARPGSRRIDISELVEPIHANPNLQALALEQLRFPHDLPLRALVAYADGGEWLDLTARVDAEGRLDWTAPAGSWTLYALFQGDHGKLVERAAPGGEGYVIDHFSRGAIERYLARFDEAFRGRDVSDVRAFFNDSYEVDDASGEAGWTPALFEAFERHRGYDLRGHLPALFGRDAPERNERVRQDYRETISDLLLETFTDEWGDWARSRGAVVRNQAHGSPANLLDLYAASDIPETEGTDLLRYKFASSAAHVAGRRLASAEAATWLNEHFTSSLADVKRSLDLFWLGGVNHVFYHGTNYSPRGEEWPGWLFYAAVHFTPVNPFWDDFEALNAYAARVQSFLQRGEPDHDALLYFPFHDYLAAEGRALLAHFDGGVAPLEGTSFDEIARAMADGGHQFDFVSDRQLQAVSADGGRLRTGGTTYRAVVVPESRFLPEATLERLVRLAEAGATVAVHRALPGDVPGLGRLDERRAAFRRLADGLRFEEAGEGVRAARVGAGRVLVGSDLERLLAQAGVRPEPMAALGLRLVRRRDEAGRTYFIVNGGEREVDGWVPLAAAGGSAALFDPMTGRSGVARTRDAGGRLEAYLQLAPGQSVILETSARPAPVRAEQPFPYVRPAGPARTLEGPWTIRFARGGPELPAERRVERPGSWTELEGEEVKRFSGTAVYAHAFPKPADGAAAYRLELGRVAESARVRLNGEEIGTLVAPPFRLLVDAERLRAENLLEIEVSNLMANRIADLDRRKVPWKKFYNVNFPSRLRENRNERGLFDASAWPPRPSGLLGPVTLTPVE